MIAKPKMLFLDDRSKRIHAALKQYSEKYDVTIVATVIECLRFLSSETWDIVSLDHDLGGEEFSDPGNRTGGMEIIRYIGKLGWPLKIPRPVFIIHSSNAFAANTMVNGLKSLGFTASWERFEYV
jgi:hypothetical protein